MVARPAYGIAPRLRGMDKEFSTIAVILSRLVPRVPERQNGIENEP